MHAHLAIEHDFPLKSLNTFGIDARARHYLRVTGPADLAAVEAAAEAAAREARRELREERKAEVKADFDERVGKLKEKLYVA